MSPVASHCAALAATLALELPIVLLLTPRGRRREMVPTLLSINLFSHALATIVWWSTNLDWYAAELAVLALEAVLLRWLTLVSWTRAFVLSGVANTASATLALFWSP